MKKIGFIGWRGMVGSVLIDRILEEKDFTPEEYAGITLFSTSQKGEKVSLFPGFTHTLADAHDPDSLGRCEILVSCQGGDYTKEIYPCLRSMGWAGYWIDASSALRLASDSVIVLDPINRSVIDRALHAGIKDYIGANCTVSVLLMAVGGLLRAGCVEWISNMTYQSVSGAGAKNMLEMVKQMKVMGDLGREVSGGDILALEKEITAAMRSPDFPIQVGGYPLAGNILPWVDTAVEGGQSREEYKGTAEAHKILGSANPIPIDGTCVRVPVLRCHSEGLTIKLKENIPLPEVENLIRSAHGWVKWVPNDRETTLKELSPVAVSGSLDIAVGRVRKMNLGEEYLNVFCVGDQLLWGAAEPLRRVLQIILGKKLEMG